MRYVDGYVLPVPKKKLKAYIRMAQMGEDLWRKHGALDDKECIGDDLNDAAYRNQGEGYQSRPSQCDRRQCV